MRREGSGPGRAWRFAVMIALASGPAIAEDQPKPNHDRTFRPSVLIRQGKSLGSGTIIASVEGTTLILTASHVVDGSESIFLEFHRFNLGLEKTVSSAGFPKKLLARIVARDIDADLAIVEIKGELAFPYVARLGPGDGPPTNGTKVTTIGFDRGERLIGFGTRIKGVEKIEMREGGGARAFLVTEDPPEHGRSGGGLFLANGALVGVCVARAELQKGRKIGLFATLGNVKELIEGDEELKSVLSRSARRLRSVAR
jgi:S1-C subfamily serine protease